MKTIKIPNGLTEEEFAEFVREEVRKVGGNPDTIYPIDYGTYYNTSSEGDHTITPVLETFEVKFNYDNYVPDSNKETSKSLSIPIEEVRKWDPDCERIKDIMDKWIELVRNP